MSASPIDDVGVGHLLVNGRIYTQDAARPWAEALAIDSGRIVRVGTDAEVAALRGTQTEVTDLGGRMAMPGLIDGHCHATKGAIANLFSCKFDFAASAGDIASALAAFMQKNPGTGWVVGGRWGSGFFDRNDIASPRRWLDERCGERPVYLRDDSGHNGWANSAALQALGITREVPDPGGGKIVRDRATGEATGILLEEADTSARQRIPDWSAAQYRAGVHEMVRIANAFGITGINDADATEPLLAAYRDVDADGQLTVYVAASISTPYGKRSTPLDYAHIEDLRDRYRSPHVDTRFAKIYQDGVPTTARTAAMLSPYTPHENFPDGFSGMLHVDEDTLAADIAELERRGFTVKLHTAGDRAVRVALNAIERAHAISGRHDLRHELAHAGLVDEADVPRFETLNVVADLSPYIWYPSPINESIRAAVGPRAEHYWPIRTLLDAGAALLAGSDWPAAVASMDPWIGIETLVTRRRPAAASGEKLWPQQAITLAQALKIFTIDGARALRRDRSSGSLAVGKSADLIVLDRDLFRIEATDIAATRVEQTYFAGRLVWEK